MFPLVCICWNASMIFAGDPPVSCNDVVGRFCFWKKPHNFATRAHGIAAAPKLLSFGFRPSECGNEFHWTSTCGRRQCIGKILFLASSVPAQNGSLSPQNPMIFQEPKGFQLFQSSFLFVCVHLNVAMVFVGDPPVGCNDVVSRFCFWLTLSTPGTTACSSKILQLRIAKQLSFGLHPSKCVHRFPGSSMQRPP